MAERVQVGVHSSGRPALNMERTDDEIFGSFSLYLDVQYFTGYGESCWVTIKNRMNSPRAFRFSDNRRSTPSSRQTGEDRVRLPGI